MTLTKSDQPLESFEITKAVVDFVVDTPLQVVPKAALEATKLVILDTIGVAIAASQRAIGQILSASAIDSAGPQDAVLLGLKTRIEAKQAARINATLANALDFDEGFHLATHVVPTALALAERDNLSGARFLDAVAIGYEFGAKLTRAIDCRRKDRRGPTARGFWHVGFVGPLTAAVVAARATGAQHNVLLTALGIASCSSGGFRRNMGTMAKALHSGNAARAGIEALDLARRGFTADPNILEAPLGFIAALCAPDERDPGVFFQLGAPHALETLRNIKRYPACTPGHPLIDAALEARDRLKDGIDSIVRVEADLHTFSLLRADPKEEDALGFSGAYLIAAALIHGAFGLDQIDEEAVHNERIRSLMGKISHRSAPSAEGEIMKIRLQSGDSVIIQVADRPRRLTTQEEIEDKFFSCAAPVLGDRSARLLIADCRSLDALTDLRNFSHLAGGF